MQTINSMPTVDDGVALVMEMTNHCMGKPVELVFEASVSIAVGSIKSVVTASPPIANFAAARLREAAAELERAGKSALN